MSETEALPKRCDSVADRGTDEPFLFRLAVAGIVFALVVAVVLLRFHRLSELPPGLAADEALDGELALKVLQGEHAPFFPVEHGREASAIYALALSTLIWGRTLLAMHLPSALGSAALVLVVFWLGQVFFGRTESGRATPWRGLLIGAIGAGLMAVSLSQTVIGRTAYNKVSHMPLLLCLCLAFLWQGWSLPASSQSVEHFAQAEGPRRRWWMFALAGLCAGLLPYTYIPARFVPVLFLLFGLSFLLPFGALARARIRAELPGIGLFAGVAGLVAAPILIYFALHPEHFFMRGDQVSILGSGSGQAGVLATFLVNVWDHLQVFGFRGDPNWRHNFPGQPMLTLWPSLFFWLGAGAAALQWRRPAYRLLLLWLGVLFLPALLSRDDTVPHFLRLTGASPAIHLLVGVGIWESFRFLRERFFRARGTGPAILVGAVAGCFILAQGATTYRTYFHKWAVASEVEQAHAAQLADLSRVLNQLPSQGDIVYLVPTFHSPYSFDYLYQGTAPAYLLHPAAPVLAHEAESALSRTDEVTTVKVVEWKAGVAGIGSDTGRLAFLLNKYGRHRNSDEHTDFHIHSYTDVFLDRAWTFYDSLEPLTVDYDGGIALQGLALGQGEQQLSIQQVFELDRDRPIWMALQWRIAPGLETDYAISLRLYDDAGQRVFQEDAVLWNPVHWPTSSWSEQEPVDTTLLLDFPVELSPGGYELRMVVYDSETLTPTVEIGVWEPETTLARLRLAEVQ